MTKFSNILKKPWFWPILGLFSQFWGKKLFFRKALSHTTSYVFLAPFQISEKTNDTIPRKLLARRTEVWTDPILQNPSGYRRGSKNWLTWRHTDGLKNKEKNVKNQHCLLSMWFPQKEYLYYPLNVEGVTQKGSLLPAHIRKQRIIMILKFLYAKADSPFC